MSASGIASVAGAAVRSRRSVLRFHAEDNVPCSACRASASTSGCVQCASYACKTSLLTHGTPAPSACRDSVRDVYAHPPGLAFRRRHVVYAPAVFTAEPGGVRTRFAVETDYPRGEHVTVRVEPERDVRFALKLRVPAWEKGGGRYRIEDRVWRRGDTATLDFGMVLRPVEFDGHLAFLRGPLVLARDARFGDGNIHAFAVPLKGTNGLEDMANRLDPKPIATSWGSFAAFTVSLRFGLDLGTKRVQTPRSVGLCDFASAAGDWSESSDCRVWLEYPVDEMTSGCN